MVSTQDKTDLVQRWFDAVDNQDVTQVLPLVDELYSPDFVLHMASGEFRGIEAFKNYVSNAMAASPDMDHIFDDAFGEGDKLLTRFTWRSTHKGEFMGIPPTGKQFAVPVYYIWRIEGGKIQECWLDMDSLFSVMQILGGEPSPG